MTAVIHPPMNPTDEDTSAHIVPWSDPLVERTGHTIGDPYVELFWLPVLGPTASWLLRRLAGGLEHEPDGYVLDLADLARSLGVGWAPGRNNPFARAMQRCAMFGAVNELALVPVRTIAVRRMLPRVPHRHIARLPLALQVAHQDWTLDMPSPDGTP